LYGILGEWGRQPGTGRKANIGYVNEQVITTSSRAQAEDLQEKVSYQKGLEAGCLSILSSATG
jgi:hypothetical protein